MKIFLLLIVSFGIMNTVHAQTDWINYKVDNRLSVKLPTHPTTISSGVVAHAKDSLICYVTIIGETDSTSLAKMISADNFADGLKNAMAQTQQGLVLGDVKADKWHGYNRYRVDGANAANKLKASFYFLIIGGRIYAFGAMMPDTHDINEKNIFFDTLMLH